MLIVMICDKNVLGTELLRAYIVSFFKQRRIKLSLIIVNDIESALSKINEKSPNIIFWDYDFVIQNKSNLKEYISMKCLKNNVNIFVGNGNVKVKDFVGYGVDYWLIIPLTDKMVNQVIQRAFRHVKVLMHLSDCCQIIITVDKIKRKINTDNILFVEKEKYKTRIQLLNQSFMVYESIKDLAGRLNEHFMRIHQSIIVNMDQVEYIKDNVIHMKNGLDFPIGRTYRKSVHEYFELEF